MTIVPKGMLIVGTAIATASIGVLVLKDRRNAPNVVGFFLCQAAALQALFLLGREWLLDQNRVPLPWNNLADASGVLFSFAAVSFALAFPQPVPRFRAAVTVLAVVSAPIAAVALAGGNFAEHAVVDGVHVFTTTPFYRVYIGYVLLCMVATFGVLVAKYRQEGTASANETARKAVGTVLIGFSGAIAVGLIFAFILPLLFHEVRYFYLQTLGFLIATLVVFYSVVRFHAFDVQTVVHKTLSWLALSSVPLAVAFWAGSWLKPRMAEASSSDWGLAIGGLAFLIGLYLYVAQPYIDQLFDRRQYNLRRTLEEMITDLAVLQELRPMAEGILARVCRVLPVEGACAMVLADSRDRLAVVASQGRGVEDSIGLQADALKRLETGEVLGLDRVRDDAVQTWLEPLNFAVCFPLVQHGQVVGAIALGKKRNLRRFSPREIAFLSRVAATATIAVSNSLLLERVRELDRLKTEFLSEIAHELRGPLFGISSIADGLAADDDHALTDDHRRLIDVIRVTAVEMKELVEHLFDLNKLEMGVMRFEVQPMDVPTVVSLAVDLARDSARAKGLALDLAIDDSLPMVQGDRARIRQCVTNLLSNAIKYTDRGTIRVSCRLHGTNVRVAVEDTGPGMGPEEVKTAFERYRRGREVAAIEGTGLGLALTKEIIEAHGGSVAVDSAPGRGSTFFFDLPVQQVTPQRVTEGSHGWPGRPLFRTASLGTGPQDGSSWTMPESLHGRGETILVADDSETDREALRASLAGKGYTVLTARDGLEALDLVRSRKPGLVVTDLMMPRLSGAELCRLLKEDPDTASVPVILVTARNSLGDMVFGIEMGADDYVAKPYDTHELAVRISALLRMRRIREDLESAQARLVEMELIATSAGTLAHAVKNPVVIIRNYVKWLRDAIERSDSRETGDALARIDAAAAAIARIIDGLKRAHLERPRKTWVHLPELLDGAFREMAETAAGADVRVVREYEDGLPPVEGDASQLMMAFTNLLTNAIEAMPNGGMLTLRVFTTGSEGIQIEIQDSGSGIRKELQEHLFKPFITTKIGGTGLGLWTARRIIEAHHAGRLVIDSVPGKGTVVRVWMPTRSPTGNAVREVVNHGTSRDSDR
ncbi:MAG: ATP-binding protein [Nitrospirota bacterium]